MRANAIVQQIHSGLFRHPTRALLILFTFVLGFGSVIGTIATTEGARRNIRMSLENLGMDTIVCLNRDSMIRKAPLLRQLTQAEAAIDHDAIRDLREELGERVTTLPLQMDLATEVASNGDAARGSSFLVIATEPDFFGAVHSGFLAGEGFPASYRRSGDEPVPIVLDEALAKEKYPETEPAALIGRRFIMGYRGSSVPVEVRGVLADPILLRHFLDFFDMSSARSVKHRRLVFKNVYVPYQPDIEVTGVLLQTPDLESVDPVYQQVQAFFDERSVKPEYMVQFHWIQHVLSIVDRFRFMTHFFWILDLMVMAILVTTITLMAAEERFPELALRRVEGARTSEVVMPLVLEGVVLSILALPFGYVLGQLIIRWWVVPILRWEPHLPLLWLTWIIPLLVAVGALTNLFPAWRVARMSPARVLSERLG